MPHADVSPRKRWSLVYLGQAYPIGSDPLVVGRSSECAVVVDDITVSRRHCSVVVGMRGPLLHDLGSRHGTLLNGETVTAPVPLVNADRIVVGSAVLIVRDMTTYARAHARTQETVRSDLPPVRAHEEITAEVDPLAAALVNIEQRMAGGARPSAGAVGTVLGLVAQRTRLSESVLQHVGATVLRAAIGGPHAFVDEVVRMFAARGVAMNADTVDALVLSIGHGGGVDRVLLLAYVAQLERAAAGAPSEVTIHCARQLRAVADSI